MIQDGGVAYGVLVALPSPVLIEMSAFAGFDFVIIDREHGAISPETLENMIRAAEASGICPFVRIRDSQPESVLVALDRGAQGIVVPHVKDPQQASRVARACRFHPRGNRGMSAAGRSSGFGTLPPSEFFEWKRSAIDEKEIDINIHPLDLYDRVRAFEFPPFELSYAHQGGCKRHLTVKPSDRTTLLVDAGEGRQVYWVS